ncbi:MAG: VacJ family lipoprotein [Campylobacteraceae bacterium]|jgi:phospholipid-binding lipoprotein MlaA|nr:VacJ family lipoprotein [Campylobacteraceae bacterium]
MRVAIACISFLLFFSGCADKNAVRADIDEDDFEAEFASNEEFDPLSGYNRAMTTFNDAAYRYAIIPAAKGYAKVVPRGARDSVNNFFDNLAFPMRFANNLLQGKFLNAASETGRFIINTTVGFLGFANVADELYGMQKHDEDFGQTLGVWGVPSGPHVVLPILGPSNVRDIGGFGVDYLLKAQYNTNFFEEDWQNYTLAAFGAFNAMADFMPIYETLTKDAIDLYPLMKNSYEQRRDKLIKE